MTQLAALAEIISLDSPFCAEQVVDRIVARFEQARRHPASGRMVPEFGREDVRELIESPYRLVYRSREDAMCCQFCTGDSLLATCSNGRHPDPPANDR